MVLGEVPPWLLRGFAGCLGLTIGSFLNVVIWRLPRGESVAYPGSHCACGKPIAWHDNIPVLSWLILRGRARCCGRPISIRYPLVELIGGALVLGILEVALANTSNYAPIGPFALRVLADALLALAIVAAAFIDLDHMYLPDPITLGGTAFALLTSPLRPEIAVWKPTFLGAALGAVIGSAGGFVVVWLPFIVLYRLIRGRPGMGLGDAKLLALIGAWFGFRGVLFALFAGSLQGTLVALVMLLTKGRIEEPESVTEEREEAEAAGDPLDPEDDPVALPPEPGIGNARIAFGPFLVLSALEYLLFGRDLLTHWASWLMEM